MKKIRLDQLLVDRGLEQSRERAKSSIMEGRVFVDNRRCDKPGMAVDSEAHVEKRGESLRWVSRGGLKLEKALKVFSCDPTGLTCLDCGASTGGFTDVLLQNGAAKVYAVDVGYGQLAWKLRQDARVVNMERTNVRYLTREQIPEEIDLAVMDLAFISIRLVLPAVHALLKENGEAICLIKPQFEAGREKVGKKGVVRDSAVHLEVLEQMIAFFPTAGFSLLDLSFSPIRGPEGNIEYLARLKKGEHPAPVLDPAALVAASHAAFAGETNPKEEL